MQCILTHLMSSCLPEEREESCCSCSHILSKLLNLFVLLVKFICAHCQMYLLKLRCILMPGKRGGKVVVSYFIQIAKSICPIGQIYLRTLSNVFVKIAMHNPTEGKGGESCCWSPPVPVSSPHIWLSHTRVSQNCFTNIETDFFKIWELFLWLHRKAYTRICILLWRWLFFSKCW